MALGGEGGRGRARGREKTMTTATT